MNLRNLFNHLFESPDERHNRLLAEELERECRRGLAFQCDKLLLEAEIEFGKYLTD